jgi:hypothetical protein
LKLQTSKFGTDTEKRKKVEQNECNWTFMKGIISAVCPAAGKAKKREREREREREKCQIPIQIVSERILLIDRSFFI